MENRGGESTLGNLVAEIQRWQTGADIGVMNPGGLRDDLIGTGDGAGPVTYREAANVQPFANTLVTVDLTGAQVKLLLEQQWQRDPDGNVPSRPFLRLGTSKGFTWTEDSSRAEGDRITGMWLDGVAIDPAATYTVSANSFLATGGDNFRALTLGTNKQDTGFTDLQATVDYLAETRPARRSPVDFAQHGVGARVPAGPFAAGDTVTIPVDSLSMTGGGSADVDTTVSVSRGATDLGTFPVTTALPTTPYDIPGAATVSFTLPSGLSGGTQWFTLTGARHGHRRPGAGPGDRHPRRLDRLRHCRGHHVGRGRFGRRDRHAGHGNGHRRAVRRGHQDRRRHPHGRRHDDHRPRRVPGGGHAHADPGVPR